MLDFLWHCHRISFHERDFHSSLLHLRMSSFFVCCCYCFQTKYFLVFSQLVPCCCITHYRGNLLTNPSPPIIVVCLHNGSCLIVFCVVSAMPAAHGDRQRIATELSETWWDRLERLRRGEAFASPPPSCSCSLLILLPQFWVSLNCLLCCFRHACCTR